MNIDELKTKTDKQLHDLLVQKREQLQDLEFKASEEALKEVHKIKEVKKTIARILTLLNQPTDE